MAEWIIEIKDGKFPIGKWTELVRCKDCKWLFIDEFEPVQFCRRTPMNERVKDNDFCSRGEKNDKD